MQFMRIGDVIRATGLSRTEIYRRIQQGRFPSQRRLSHRVSVWVKGEVDQWMGKMV
jgi:prophage regulatory protein